MCLFGNILRANNFSLLFRFVFVFHSLNASRFGIIIFRAAVVLALAEERRSFNDTVGGGGDGGDGDDGGFVE